MDSGILGRAWRGKQRARRKVTADRHLARLGMEPLEQRTLLDAGGPFVTDLSPRQVRNDVFDHVDVTFSVAIDAQTFEVDDVRIEGTRGDVNVTGIAPLGDDAFRVDFDPITVRGSYRVAIGPEIADLSGNLMDQDQDGLTGDPTSDVFQADLVYVDAATIFSTTTTIAQDNLAYEGTDILVDGATITINGPHSFNSLHLINGAVVTHSANTATQTFKLDLTVSEEIIVDSSSRIDVTGKGYRAERTTGNTTVGGARQAAGGSYGGLGGIGPQGTLNAIYADYRDPNDWGSGGGNWQQNSIPIGVGGGLV